MNRGLQPTVSCLTMRVAVCAILCSFRVRFVSRPGGIPCLPFCSNFSSNLASRPGGTPCLLFADPSGTSWGDRHWRREHREQKINNILSSWTYSVAYRKAALCGQEVAVLPDAVLFSDRLNCFQWKQAFRQWKDRVEYWAWYPWELLP